MDERLIPPDPLAFLADHVRRGKVLWTYHVNMRFGTRPITRDRIIAAVGSFQLIEAYPEDKYLPSYLVRCEDEAGIFHVLIAADVAGGNVRVVTAYLPDPQKWEDGFYKRRRNT